MTVRPKRQRKDTMESNGSEPPSDDDDDPEMEIDILNIEVSTLDDLILVAKDVTKQMNAKMRSRKKYKKNKGSVCSQLKEITKDLVELQKLIGLSELKNQIAMQIVFLIQGLGSDELMHTAIMGPPGMAKTTVSNILAKIYGKLGFLSKGHVTVAKRSDLIGQYLGETSIKTTKLLTSCKGGVLLIDEAYQLGDGGRSSGDSYSAECLNAINQFLSENSRDFMCIIAGYKEQIDKCFFGSNPGLDRRFPWKFTTTPYNMKELCSVFQYQLKETGWTCEDSELAGFIDDNMALFKNNGGDTLTLFDKCKMSYAQRTFTMKKGSFKVKHINSRDLNNAIRLLKSLKNIEHLDKSWQHMYL